MVPALVLGALAFTSVAAQDRTEGASLSFSSAHYRVGERLTYNVSYSSFISAGYVELLVAARGTFFGREGMQLKGHVETKGTVNAAVLALNNDYITYVDPNTGLPFHGQQFIRAASRTSDTSADFNQPAGAAALAPGRVREFPGVYDLLSAVYRIRALPLKENSTYYLTMRVENTDYQVEVKVTGQEVVKTNVGSFNTIVSRIWVKNGSDSYGMKAYFSGDDRHVPVLVSARHATGEIRAELAASEFIATPPLPPASSPTPVAANPSTPRLPVAIPAQPSAPNDGALSGLPFKVGEQLNYQVYLPSIKQPVATASFQVRARSKYFDKDGLLFNLTAQTTNALQHLFFATDTIVTYVDPKTLLPFQAEHNLIEGRRRSNTKLTINQDYGTATTDKNVRIEIPVGTHDYLSFFYALRTFNLNPPRRNAVSILVDNKPKTLFISALKRETIQLGSQTIPAIQISLTTDDAQSDKFQLRAWISDDARRLPLRLAAVTELGPVRAELAILPVTRQ
ncbi:MAG: DUF3108 domain-containing protein [Pyrinomonadaceae bacterium]|nr:DUF3108 domain-containing protein [Pyrinomonadaceae bacterium]